jgi:hypothetical protein
MRVAILTQDYPPRLGGAANEVASGHTWVKVGEKVADANESAIQGPTR